MITVSVVIPIYNEAKCIDSLISVLIQQQPKCQSRFELVFIDDGSTDNSWDILRTLMPEGISIRLARFSRNFGKEAAVTCGLRLATGDVVVIMDADLQDPPELLPQMLEVWRSGVDIVCPKRIERKHDRFIKRVTAKLFYKLFHRISEAPVNVEVGDFRLLDRKVVEILNQMPENTRYMKGLMSWPGFKQQMVPFSRPARVSGKTKFDFWALCRLALDGIISFSSMPLRIWSFIGLVIVLIALIYVGLNVIDAFFRGLVVPAYVWLIASIALLAGIQLISIGVLGEYISRLYKESKQRPLFVIEQLRGVPEMQLDDLKKSMPKELAAIQVPSKRPVRQLSQCR